MPIEEKLVTAFEQWIVKAKTDIIYNPESFIEDNPQKLRKSLYESFGQRDTDIALDNYGKKNGKYEVYKSKRHYNGELCFGGDWFVVVAILPTGQISNHYEMKDWDLFDIPEYEKSKYEFDGHTSQDVLKRLEGII